MGRYRCYHVFQSVRRAAARYTGGDYIMEPIYDGQNRHLGYDVYVSDDVTAQRIWLAYHAAVRDVR